MTCPRECPRWDGCSAPVCPLDGDWHRCQHLPGERVCGLLCELAKGGGEARLRAALPCALVDRLAEVGPMLAARWERVRRRLGEASRTGSRMAAGQQLARCKGVAVVDAGIGAGMGASPVSATPTAGVP